MTYLSLFLTVLAWTVFVPLAVFAVLFLPPLMAYLMARKQTPTEMVWPMLLWGIYIMPFFVLSGCWLAIHYGVNL